MGSGALPDIEFESRGAPIPLHYQLLANASPTLRGFLKWPHLTGEGSFPLEESPATLRRMKRFVEGKRAFLAILEPMERRKLEVCAHKYDLGELETACRQH